MNIDRRGFMGAALFASLVLVAFAEDKAGSEDAAWLLQTNLLERASAPKGKSGLPKVLVLGDSISLGYTPFVKEKLAGVAEVSRPACNCGPSEFYLKSMRDWVGTNRWDVIHVNFGIWDNHYLKGPADGMGLFWGRELTNAVPPVAKGTAIRDLGFRIRTPIKDYERNLRTILAFLKTRADNVVFGLTTPLKGWESDDRCGRIRVYNELAAEVCREMDVGVSDLYAVAERNLDKQTDGCHFSPEGYDRLADAVVESIRRVLPKNRVAEMTSTKTFVNPIGEKDAADPFVTYDAATDYYYCLHTEGTVVRIRRAREPQRLLSDNDVKTLLVTNAAQSIYGKLWAPEMHKAPNGRWYVYTSADTTPDPKWTLRLVCLESETSDPFDGFRFKSFPLPDVQAIDPTVHWTADGRGYLVCARMDDAGECLAIYGLADPWTCRGKGVELTRPTLAWEKKAGSICEGAFFVKGTGRNLFLVYSANDTCSENYALGALAFGGGDPMDAGSWQKRNEPVLFKANGVYGPGHASFFRTRGGELWCAYHAMETPDGEERALRPRKMHLQPADPDDDGCPHLAGAWGKGPHRVPDAPKEKLPPLPDGAFTYVVIPDTQRYHGKGSWSRTSEPPSNPAFESRVNWIMKNAKRENIVFVSHVGDISDRNNVPQYLFASNLMSRLDGVVPWRTAAGNHDMVDTTGDTAKFERYFGSPNRVDLFEAGGMKFVLVTLVCNAPEAVMRWADEQLEKHADRKAIVCTHAYLGPVDPQDRSAYARRDGKAGPYECRIPDERLGRMPWRSSFREASSTNGLGHTGETMWREHLAKHANLFLIVCGDQSAVVSQHRVDTGANGNVVHAFMQDYPRDNDRGDALRVFRFLPSEKRVEIFTVWAGEDVLCTRAKFLEEHHRFTFGL